MKILSMKRSKYWVVKEHVKPRPEGRGVLVVKDLLSGVLATLLSG